MGCGGTKAVEALEPGEPENVESLPTNFDEKYELVERINAGKFHLTKYRTLRRNMED